MLTIKTYTDTMCELKITESRLNFLMDKKEKLYCKYFPITSKPKEIVADGGERDKEKMSAYLHELHELDIGTGKSLAEEIEFQQANTNRLKNIIHDMNVALSNMTGLEYVLYYEIVVLGTPITKAVEKLSEKTDVDIRSMWRTYKKIKKSVKKIQNVSEMSVNFGVKCKM